MHLSELREQYTLDELSQKTLISPKNLEALFDEEYALLTKTKTLGFLSILEREFHVDIKDMKQNALQHFGQGYTSTTTSTSTVSYKEEEKKRGLGWYMLIVVAVLGYVAWYFLIHTQQKSLHDVMPVPSPSLASVDTKETNMTTHTVEKEKSQNIFSKIKALVWTSDTKVDKKIPYDNVTATSMMEIVKDTDSSEKDFFTKIKDFFSFSKEASIENDISISKASSIVVVNQMKDNSTMVSSSDDSNENESSVSEKSFFTKIKAFVFSFTDTEKETTASYNSSVVVEKDVKKVQDTGDTTNVIAADSVEKQKEPATVPNASTVRIEPVKYLWFGLVNRDTGKRDYFSIRKPYTLDVSKNSWLVATNSNAFSLVSHRSTKYFSTSIEHYFSVSKDTIEVLSRDEYIAKGGYAKW